VGQCAARLAQQLLPWALPVLLTVLAGAEYGSLTAQLIAKHGFPQVIVCGVTWLLGGIHCWWAAGWQAGVAVWALGDAWPTSPLLAVH